MEKTLNQPLGGNEMPRFGGPATMMRLPSQPSSAGLDACFIGVPMDIGTSNRAGTRHGPRQIRAESCLIRVKGFREVIDAHNASSRAKIEIVTELESGGAKDQGYKAAEEVPGQLRECSNKEGDNCDLWTVTREYQCRSGESP